MTNGMMKKIKNKELALGAWINSTDPLIAEIFATFGCDWVFIDMEHEPIGRRDLMGLILGLKGTACTSLVRIPENRPEHIKWILDLGAGGIIIPQINSVADVEQAIKYTRYDPLGERGMGAMRAALFGKDSEYYQRANSEVVVMPEIENIHCLDNLEEILAVEGVDAIFIGPMDLAQSMGHLSQPEHPEVQSAIEQIIKRSSRAGKPVAIGVKDLKELRLRINQGATIFILGSDYRFVRDGIKAKLSEAKTILLSR